MNETQTRFNKIAPKRRPLSIRFIRSILCKQSVAMRTWSF